MESNSIIECGGFYFIHNFDSGNLGHVERVPTELIAPTLNHKSNIAETPSYEFNLWTRPDCAGTEFENGNRTWFYFGVQAPEVNAMVRLNLINLNKQGKMYNQGMAPVTRTLPGKPQWERIRDRPIHSTDDNTFTLTFRYKTSENLKATTFFAFTYPFSFAELQIALNAIDLRMLPLPPTPQAPDDIYYHRECLVYSLEGRRVDLLTITSHHGITTEREERLQHLFPDKLARPFKFQNKKIIFVSARVHPGETPSSFVFNGFLNLLLTKNDPIAIQLRKLYVFKMIPFLNPDGVARGHYRTDTRGVNLNRVYLNPTLAHHPTVYASRSLIRYYHFGCEKEDSFDDLKSIMSNSIQSITESSEIIEVKKKKPTSITVKSADITKSDSKKSSRPIPVKSGSSIKVLAAESHKKDTNVVTAEAATLVDQVYDLKIHEPKSQTIDIKKPSNQSVFTLPTENTTVLNDDVLKSCLGSSIHLSTSEELKIQGQNPLRPLRDALKNSISLLMDSSSSVGDSSLFANDSLKMGWCKECRQAVDKLEDSMPGIGFMVPGYTANAREGDVNKEEKSEMVYFCTNCFKRYTITDNNEEVNLSESPLEPPSTSDQLPCSMSGDSGDARVSPAPQAAPPTPTAPPRAPTPAKEIEETPSVEIPPKKEEKPKTPTKQVKKKTPPPATMMPRHHKEPESGLYLYIDLHGHASKKGIFMYGNHFDDLDNSVECMLLPRIMSLNNLHFHFSSCNFTERNMYLKDRRDGMSREGSGRVAVLKATGLVRSYTLECNYNTGRLVNVLPPTVKDGPAAPPVMPSTPTPPKYTPHIYEEVRTSFRPKCSVEVFRDIDPLQVGRSLGASILDLTGQHPNSRIPCSEHRNLSAVREWLRAHTRSLRPPQLAMSRLRPKPSSPTRMPLYSRPKGKTDTERKENTYAGAKTDSERKRSPPVLAPRAAQDVINLNMKYGKKNEPVKTSSRTRYLAENEPKPKTLSSKRRNILAIRKPNASKTRVDGVVKTKSRRSVEGSESPRGSLTPKLSKRVYSRNLRPSRNASGKPLASSSSDDMIGGNWEEVGTILGSQAGISETMSGKRRSFPNPSPSGLKKIRLKTVI